MIKSSFNRLGTLVMQTILKKLSQEAYQVAYRKFMKEFQSNAPEKMYFQSGRSKVNDVFPNIGIEIESRKDEWQAINYTKNLEYRFKIYVAVKAAAGPKGTDKGEINEVENYIIALSEFVFEALNEPIEALQYLIEEDQDGKTLSIPIKIYDSLAEGIQYGYLYNGALRIGEIDWRGSILRLGPPSGAVGQTGY